MTDHVISRHGLWYRSRDGEQTYWLDIGADVPQRMLIPRPERDVAIALLRFSLRRLEQDNANEEVQL